MKREFEVYDDTANKRTIPGAQMEHHFRIFLGPILSEIGMSPEGIAAHNGDLYQLIGCVIAHLRDMNSRVETARIQYRKLRKKQESQYELMMKFIETMLPKHVIDNIIDLEERRKAA